MKYPTLLLILCTLNLGLVSASYAQDEESSTYSEKVGDFKGTVYCTRCHENPSTQDEETGVTDFVFLDEYTRWLATDVHARSYIHIIPSKKLYDEAISNFGRIEKRVITSELIDNLPWEESKSNQLAQQIYTLMGYGSPDDLELEDIEGSQFAKDCLTCHADYSVTKGKVMSGFKKYGFGVGCESCHGGSVAWEKEHTDPKWRKLPPHEKSKLGMVDFRNPADRAEKCYSCHIGNINESKFVTHKMYAAGHPPLPSIELGSYGNQTSKHWRSLKEKPDFQFRKEYEGLVGFTPGDMPESKTVVVGGAVALKQSLEILSSLAVNAQKNDNAEWPDFSAYDCAACHHDLKSPSWRQKRGYKGVPGRPTIHYWPNALSDLMGPLPNQAALLESMNRVPFGNPMELANASSGQGSAMDLVKKLDAAIWKDKANGVLNLQEYDVDQAYGTLKGLCETGVMRASDYNSARQVGWAIRTMANEISRTTDKYPVLKSAEFKTAIAQLSTDLQLDLPAGAMEIMVEREGTPVLARMQKAQTSQVTFVPVFGESEDMKPFVVSLKDLEPKLFDKLRPGFGIITRKQGMTLGKAYEFEPSMLKEALMKMSEMLK